MKEKQLKEYLLEARRKGRAVPAFNYSDIWDLMAIAMASAKTGIPVMAASIPPVAETFGVELCRKMVDFMGRKFSATVYSHLDHCKNLGLCRKAVDAGYDSVMFDGSALPLDENITLSSEVVEYAHGRNVIVEAEIGRIKGRGAEGGSDASKDFLAKVEDAIAIVEEAGIDILAPGIGTAHGFYTSKPEINFTRLGKIARSVEVPLALHGGTGIPNEDIRKAVKCGISKVNVGTIIHSTYLKSLKAELLSSGENPYTIDVMKNVLPKIVEVIVDRINVITA